MSRKRRKRHALFLLDPAGSVAVLRDRLVSKRWWAFVAVNGAGLGFVADLEQRHYTGRANGDFEMMAIIVPGLGTVAIGLGRKRRLSPRQLSRLFDEAGMLRHAEEVVQGRDVIIFPPSTQAGERAAQWLLAFVRGEPLGATCSARSESGPVRHSFHQETP